MITQADSHESLKNSLANLANENLQALTTSASLERLKRVETLMRENLNNGKEEFWQQTVFNENQWVLAQIFSCPCTIYAQKAFVGGKSLNNKGGNQCDHDQNGKLGSAGHMKKIVDYPDIFICFNCIWIYHHGNYGCD